MNRVYRWTTSKYIFRPFSLDHLQQRLGRPVISVTEEIRVENIPHLNDENFQIHQVRDITISSLGLKSIDVTFLNCYLKDVVLLSFL